MKKWLKDNQPVFVLVIVGIACFFVYSFLAFSAPKEIFNSPDETANYVFSCNYANGSMKIAEPDNLKVQGMIHPRSTTSNYNGDIVPASFLGMPIILGFLAKLFSCNSIPFIVPIISAITPIFLYFGLKRIFEKEIAVISSLLLYFHPIFIYYTAKGLMPNVLFVDFLIISLSLALCASTKIKSDLKGRKIWKKIKSYFNVQPLLFYLFSGLFLGLALTIRPSEIFWIFFIYLVLFIYRIHKVNWPGLFLGLCAMAIAIVPTLWLNFELYGGYFKLGYNTRLLGIETAESSAGVLNNIKALFAFSLIFPFGIKLAASIKIFINYFWRFLGWYNVFLIPGIIGFIAYLINDNKLFVRKYVYTFITIFVSAYLILYYGSYVFHDHVDISKISIGTSYLRYWLPVFVLLLPFMAYCLYAIWRFFEKRKVNIKVSITIVFLLILNFYTFNIVFVDTDESLFAVRKNLQQYSKVRQIVLEKTEDNAIIITDRSDKIFFPKRKVIIFQENYAIFPLAERLVETRPIYYYSMYLPDDMNYINQTKIKENLKFEMKEQIDNFYLYRLTKQKNEQ